MNGLLPFGWTLFNVDYGYPWVFHNFLILASDLPVHLQKSEKDRESSWEPVCRVLLVMLSIADKPRSASGRVGLLLGGAIEALMPCLGLPKPEVIRSALEVRRKYFVPLVPFIFNLV